MGELQAELQRLSRTTLDAQGAANAWAGTAGLDLIGALNVKAGTTGLDLLAVLNRLAGSSGLGESGAAALIPGTVGLRLPGTAGNYASSPDSVLHPTGDIDIRVCLAMTDWTPAAQQRLVGKYGAAGQRSFIFGVAGGGSLEFNWSPDGTALVTKGSATITGFADGTAGWARVTLDVDNGAGGNDVKFYTSADGVTWTQLGATQTTAGVTNVFDSTAVLELGSIVGGTVQNLAGTIFYAEVRAGIDGEVVSRFDASRVQSSGAQVPATVNGWTLNGTALYRRDDYVRFTGAASNFISWPDSAAVSITGDLDLRVKASLDDWTPAAEVGLVAKFLGGANYSYSISVRTDGTLRLYTSTLGNNPVSSISSVATGVTDGATKWVRATLDIDFDGTNGQVKFYLSDDGTTWTQLGTTITRTGTVAIFDGTAELRLGVIDGAAAPLTGNVYAAEVRAGIDGQVVASFNARDIETPWTVNGAGWSWEGASFTGKPTTALSLPGTAGNYVSQPDSEANSVTGDIDMRVKASSPTWTSAVGSVLIGKRTAAGSNISYYLRLDTNGDISGTVSLDGATLSGRAWPNPGFAPGSTQFIRVTRTTAGAWAFYTSPDDGVTWTLRYTPAATAAGNIFDSTSPLLLGAYLNGATGFWEGTIYYAEVRKGIDGPIVARFDPTAIARTGTRTPTTTVQPGGTPNLLTPNQASIETDATGYAVGTGAPTLTRSTAQFLDGVASLSIAATAVGPADFSARTNPATTVPVVPGKLYTARASFRAATAARNTQVQIFWHDAAQAFMSAASGTQVADTTTGWTEVTATGVAPANAAFGRIDLMVKAGLASEVHYVDRVSLVESAATWTMNGSSWDLVAV